jgi:hypothetical protein
MRTFLDLPLIDVIWVLISEFVNLVDRFFGALSLS